MKTIADLFGINMAGIPKDAFGVELELEGNENPVCSPEFIMEHDGSLRRLGMEYVFTKPLGYKDSCRALCNLKNTFRRHNNRPIETNLASTHIHINVGWMNYKQVLNFICLVMTFEVGIAKNSGLDRWQNYFAVGSCENDDILLKLSGVSSEKDFHRLVMRLRRGEQRYAGINLLSLLKYGTIEIRYLGAQPDPTKVIPWLRFYNALRAACTKEIFWHNIFEIASSGDFEYLEESLQIPFKLNEKDLIRGIRNAQDVVFPVGLDGVWMPRGENALAKYYEKLA